MIDTYQPIVTARLVDDSPLRIEATWALLSPDWSQARLDVNILVTGSLDPDIYRVHFVVAEDGVENKAGLVREELASELFTLTVGGEAVDLERSFSVGAGWVPENLRPVVFVQNHGTTREVLQAGLAQPDYAATLVVDAEPDGLGAAWRIDGPDGWQRTGADDATVPVWLAGDYTVTWQPVPGWTAPAASPELRSVAEGETATFTGVYTDPPFVAVTDGLLGDDGPGRGVCLVDHDGDGDLDIFVVNHGAANLLLCNDGAGGFSDAACGPEMDPGPTAAAAWADYDRDGDLDLYLVRDGAANALLRNEGDGAFAMSGALGLDDAGHGRAAAWSDFDRDGWPDLYLVNADGANKLLRSFGDLGGTFYFAEVSGPVADAGDGSAAMWCDYDNDGDQDIYLTNSYGGNRLLQNNHPVGWFDAGSGALGDTGNGAGIGWGDFDGDGWLDLFFANDGGQDRLLKNGGGSFVLVPGSAIADLGHGRGVTWGDFDNDMDLDLYVARDGQADLYLLNQGANVFVPVPLAIPETAAAGCGAAAGDLDGDGDLDVYVVNDGAPNVLLRNEKGQDWHWLQVRLEGGDGRAAPAGARVRCVGGFRSQIRELTCGGGYRSQDSPDLEFGLWWADVVDTLQVTWPDGSVQTLRNLPTEQVVRVRQTDVTAVGGEAAPAAAFALHPARPNPFNPRTTVSYHLAADGPVSLRIYDLAGRLVRVLREAAVETAGVHEAVWDGRDDGGRAVASGTYLCRLESGRQAAVQRLVLVR